MAVQKMRPCFTQLWGGGRRDAVAGIIGGVLGLKSVRGSGKSFLLRPRTDYKDIALFASSRV